MHSWVLIELMCALVEPGLLFYAFFLSTFLGGNVVELKRIWCTIKYPRTLIICKVKIWNIVLYSIYSVTVVHIVKLAWVVEGKAWVWHNLWLYGNNPSVVLHKIQAVLLIHTINGLAQGQLPAGRKGQGCLAKMLNLFCFVEGHIWMHQANITVARVISFCKLLLFLPASLGEPFD